ncbi:MAG: uracil-DNA glycosylase [Pseudomonadota bacterium]
MESSKGTFEHAALAWLVELGATEAICDAPINRYELPVVSEMLKTPRTLASPMIATTPVDPVEVAEQAALGARDLEELRAALAAFDLCDLKQGARNLVFSDGIPGAKLMLIGEAPGRDEDRLGKPFVGRAGQLLDRMLAAIEYGRTQQDAPVYLTNVLPWRPPQNRDPKPQEVAIMRPFLMRHIALAQPKVLGIVGNWSCQALLGKKGITRLRGQWTEAAGLPAMPMFHPAYLLRSPQFKKEAWADLLSLKARLRTL